MSKYPAQEDVDDWMFVENVAIEAQQHDEDSAGHVRHPKSKTRKNPYPVKKVGVAKMISSLQCVWRFGELAA